MSLDPDIRQTLEEQERARQAKASQGAEEDRMARAPLTMSLPVPDHAVGKPAPLDDGAALHIERKGSELRVYVTTPRGVTGTRSAEGPRWTTKTMAQADAVAKLLGAVERQKGNPETGARVYRLPETSWERL